jgi:hypothetical protein
MYRMTQNKLVQPVTGRHQEERKQPAGNQKRTTVGRKERPEALHQMM